MDMGIWGMDCLRLACNQAVEAESQSLQIRIEYASGHTNCT